MGENKATPIERIKVREGFRVELIYSVPLATQGSWVNLCLDPQGRLIAADQHGALYRFPVPAPGTKLDPATIETIDVPVKAVNGMVWAFGALYVVVNDYERKMEAGLYRITDTDGDDHLDRIELLRGLSSGGDHGAHAVLLTPDGKGLYVVCGNNVKPTTMSPHSPVPAIWGEDHLLPRMPDGRGFMRDKLAPGGIIYRVTPDGRDFEVFAAGFRNIFDAAIDRDGELFTYDADMETDFNTSWYRPTRVCHVVSGGEYGWRNGAGKRPAFYEDNLPPTIDIGPGSPTGVSFGYGAKFPAKYQQALYVQDWSWGKLYAVHLEPSGASYRATKEEFLTGTPLPMTDLVVHPGDGAMYFTIGGRRVQSGLYRVTYQGKESTEPAVRPRAALREHIRRHALESFHGGQNSAAVEKAWPQLDDADRFVRWAARTAVEHQAVTTWQARALQESVPERRIEALLALTRVAAVSPPQRRPETPPVDVQLGKQILSALLEIDPRTLSREWQQAYVRTLQVALNRFEPWEPSELKRVWPVLDPLFPSDTFPLNWLLAETLVYVRSPTVAAKATALMASALTQEEQIEYARSLRVLDTGWTLGTRQTYFEWFLKAANYRGGASFSKFIENIRADALATLSKEEHSALAVVLDKKPERLSAIANLGFVFAGRPQTDWKLADLEPALERGLRNRNYTTGREMFAAAACFACHRFGNEGGMIGPDLTSAGSRYSPRDLLKQILDPSSEINEQFVPTVITKTNGETITGTIVNLGNDNVTVNTDLSDPTQKTGVDRKQIRSIEPSKVSPMPPMLLSSMTEEEILDLLAYILSGGDRRHDYFLR